MAIQNPGLELPFGIQPTNPLPVDTWSGPYYGTTLAEASSKALSSIPVGVRFLSMEIRLALNDNQVYKYWFNGGVLDTNFQPVQTEGLDPGLTTVVQSNSSNWDFGYNVATTYQNASGSFATNTLLQSTSALLTPLTLTNTLTGQLVLNTDFDSYKTNVAAATATLLPTSIYQSASGNWQNTFTTVQSNSAYWEINNIDGGSSTSVYLLNQNINGGLSNTF